MKKFLSVIAAVAAFTLSAFGFSACKSGNDGNENEAVKLVFVDAAQVGTQSGIDYFVVAEPAASAKVNAVEGLEFAGNLQTLYGGENGYPQAVVVAKSSLVESDGAFLSAFTQKLKNANAWLSDSATTPQRIVDAVQAHASEGMQTTLNAKTLTKQVIQNCSIDFTDAKDCKEEIISFMQKLNAVQDFGTPQNGFFAETYNTQSSQTDNIKVVMPDGATAVGLAELMSTDVDLGKTVNYEVVNSNAVQGFVTGANPRADICVLPLNMAVKLLGGGQNYKLLGTLTHGNLYIVSKSGVKLTSANMSELRGKTVGVIMLAAVPGLTFKVILNEYGIVYSEQ